MPPAKGRSKRKVAKRPTETSAEAVARYVRQLVLDGTLTDGQRLPQDEIAEAIGVSRIPVREAIIALESEGWVRVEPHRGAFVNGLDDHVVRDHYELYGRYFAFAARRAIERLNPSALDRLDGLAATMAEVDADDADAVTVANEAYLDAVIATAASPRLDVVLRSIIPIVPDFFAAVPGAVPAQQRFVARLHDAIRTGSAKAAEQACLDLGREQAAQVTAMLHASKRGAQGLSGPGSSVGASPPPPSRTP